MDKQILLADLALLLEVDVATLSDETVLDSESYWDSLAVVSMVGAIDQHYDIMVTGTDLMDCQCVGDIFGLIERKRLQVVE